MCGIAGIYAYADSAPPVDRDELLRVRDAMAKRGPDGAGLWISSDGRSALAHRRLSIIDLSETGAQPMATRDGRLRITFNGEIYNYRALRAALEGKGYRFHSTSDTEVLLHLYADRGTEMVHALRGMYAFAIWDERDRSLFLARDPFGIKPLYYADDGKTFRFASQVKALLAGGAIDTAPDPAGSVGFLVWGSVPEPHTLYRSVRCLPAGCCLRLHNGGPSHVARYFDLNEEFRYAQDTSRAASGDQREVLRSALADSVRHHLVSDVPVGLFLSAGFDSSTLAGLAAEHSEARLRAITLGFPEYRGTPEDEVPLAQVTAEHYGLQHEADWVTRADFERELGSIMAAMDQPSIDGVNTYFVSRAAARAGMKVALSGLGGDELFGGYPSFSQVPRTVRALRYARIAPLIGPVLRRALAPLLRRLTSPKYASLVEYGHTYGGAYLLRRALYLPWEASQVLDPATVQCGLDALRVVETLEERITGLEGTRPRIAALELGWYMRHQLLRDADWAGMAHSVEIRVPLVDVALFRAVAPLLVRDGFPTKTDLAGVLRKALPPEVRRRAKSGFSTPVREWTTKPREGGERGLRGWARRVLPSQPRMFRAIALVTDAFGGVGGIAKFNRDLIASLASLPACSQVVVLPRLIVAPADAIPERTRQISDAARGKWRFTRATLAEAWRGHYDLVVAGHINLAPLGFVCAQLARAKSILIVHGIDAWSPHRNPLVRASLPSFTAVAGVSDLTLERFATWAAVGREQLRLLPNCVDVTAYGPGRKPAALAARLGLQGRRVIMTLGRLAAEERYKGFDEVLEALPAVAQQVPDISYLICGDGPDRARLEVKARVLGVHDRVVFTGFVAEREKADYYRLADAYVMPSRGEGFGIVFLEALACGIPTMGSRIDGGREALLGGQLGALVDPSDSAEVAAGIVATLKRGRGELPEQLRYYSREAFARRARAIVEEALALP